MSNIAHNPRANPFSSMATGARPQLSHEARTALTAATKELHRLAWDIAQVAIDLDDCETLAANVLVAYFSAIAADEDAVYYTDHTQRRTLCVCERGRS